MISLTICLLEVSSLLVAAVSSQSYPDPRFEFNNSVLVNNSFIIRGQIRNIDNISLHCVTNNSECCNNGEGHWYDQRGNVVNVTYGTNGGIHLNVTRGDGVIYLNRRTGGSSGMWRCDIPDRSGDLKSIFIYTGSHKSGKLTSAVIYFTLDSEVNEEPPEFTLTCQSRGGPATEVVWTRNEVTVEEDSNHTTSQIIVDTSANTVYNNTLRVRGREPGRYVCTVNSNRYVENSTQSNISVIQVAELPLNFTATYSSNTIILLEWTFSNTTDHNYSYVVYYQTAEGSKNVTFTDDRDNNTYLLNTGLPAGYITSISLVALADLPSPIAGPITPESKTMADATPNSKVTPTNKIPTHDPQSNVVPQVVAAIVVIFVLLAITLAVVLIFLRWKNRGKCSGKITILSRLEYPEKNESNVKVEEFQMDDLSVSERSSEETTTAEKGFDNSIQDRTTSIAVSTIDPIPVEKFPEYVKHMLYEKKNKLKAEFSALDVVSKQPATVAVLPCNKEHNRFKNIYPYDQSRVCLKPDNESSDYINASFVDGYGGIKKAYIASQGPTEVSVEHFWRMVWEHELPTIVMLTQCIEAGKKKCFHYWPEKVHDSLTIGRFRITFSSHIPFAESELRKFKLENLTEKKHMTVTHLHYTAWPDHGVPDNVMSIIAFIRHVRKIHPISNKQPLLVHCSAGVGRTGTLILLDIIMQQMKRENTISILHWLRTIRLQRMKLVQTQQQYEFIHCGLSELVVCGETEVAAVNLMIKIKSLKKLGGDGLSGFQKQMKIIEEVGSHQPVTFSEAEKEYSISKNRFTDKIPNDAYRVILRSGSLPGSDYINASFVNGYKQKGAYIATQCPMKNTVDDFWRMINEFSCGCIFLIQEDGEEGSHRFWPEEEGESVVYGKLSVKLVSTKTLGDIVTRKLEMVEGAAKLNRPHIIHFLQLTSWPSQGLPHPIAILSLIDQLTSTLMKCPNRRTVIMCSDGVSRTGTFFTIHCQLERLKTEGVVDFPQAIKSARLQRPGIVNNTEHYVFCHEVANKYLDNFDTYANFAI